MTSNYQKGFLDCLIFCLDAVDQLPERILISRYLNIVKRQIEGGMSEQIQREMDLHFADFLKQVAELDKKMNVEIIEH